MVGLIDLDENDNPISLTTADGTLQWDQIPEERKEIIRGTLASFSPGEIGRREAVRWVSKVEKRSSPVERKHVMTDTATTPAASVAPPVEPKPEQPKANGVTRPTSGTKTGKVWDVADEISTATKAPATRKAVMEKCADINPATVATQYGKWRRFNGLTKERAEKAPAAPAAPVTEANAAVATPPVAK